MSTYRERREARVQRLEEWAGKREARSEAAWEAEHKIGEMIPLGQPILVGHHSEGRARRDVARMQSLASKSLEHSRKAEEMRSKAANIAAAAERAIYSDDPDAPERLAEKLASLEAERDRIKAFNASCRKGDPDFSVLTEQERSEYDSTKRVAAYMLGKRGEMPRYVLTNLGGNITRTRKRLEQVTA
jgi:hypothetical protein